MLEAATMLLPTTMFDDAERVISRHAGYLRCRFTPRHADSVAFAATRRCHAAAPLRLSQTALLRYALHYAA